MYSEQTPMLDIHRATLLEVSDGLTRITPSYPPAVDLVNEGYCAWRDGDAGTWDLELTDLGRGAVALLKYPDDTLELEEVDPGMVYRITQNANLRGTAIRYPNDRWVAFDEYSNRMTYDDYASPRSVLLMIKMRDAELMQTCVESLAEDGFEFPEFDAEALGSVPKF